jgi:hypothetical protein
MTVYEVLNKAIEKEYVDFNKYELMFALANQEVFDVKDNETAKIANKEVRKNYICIRDIETKDSVLQLWGWARKGAVVVEVRKTLRKKLDLNSLKTFKECERDKNDNYITKDIKTALLMTKTVFDRLTKASTTATEKKETANKTA